MEKSFGEIYAKYYDIIYSDKNYEKECDFLEEIFQYFLNFKPTKILDIGCGTGGHLIPLAKRGYEVVGIEPSTFMLQIAKEKMEKEKLSNVKIYQASSETFTLNDKFDVCVCMFAVINYITQTDNLIQTFKNIRKHLKTGGLLIFDFWYGPAVLTIKPSVRIKIMERERDLKVIRTVTPELNTLDSICKSHYYLLVIKGNKVIEEARETHVIRYFFFPELHFYLKNSGFDVLKICEFLNLEKSPSENTWNVTLIAKAR